MPDPIYLSDAAGPYFNDWRGNQVREGDKVIYPSAGGHYMQEAEILKIMPGTNGVYHWPVGGAGRIIPGAVNPKIKVQIMKYSYGSPAVKSKPSYPNANKVTKLVVSND